MARAERERGPAEAGRVPDHGTSPGEAGRGRGAGPPVVGVVVAAGRDLPRGLEALAGEAEVRPVRTPEELEAILDRVEALAVYDFRTTLVRRAVPGARRLRWIHAASAGLDAVLSPEVAASDVVVTNSRGVFDRGIAEWVLGVILVFAKDLHTSVRLQDRREWRHRDSEIVEGKRVLVVGAGSIGRAVARLLRGVGMEVDGVARTERTDDPDFGRVAPPSELPALLGGADFVVIAAPLTPETREMFGAEALAAMRPTARLVNVGRGPVVDETALVEALRSGRIAGAALDVFEREPLPPDSPLWEMPNVIVSPHMSGDFVGWVEALSELFVENFRRWRRGEELRNVVDKARALPGDEGP